MRLIDADAFVKELEIWHRNALAEKAELNAFFSSNFIDMVNMMPTVDAVPVIRCKDCKKFVDEEDQSYCVDMAGQCDSNGFCAWAERREE